jgi:release factor glutamine methyltransferase
MNISAAGVPEVGERPSVRQLLDRATAEIQASGADTPQLDAEVLLAHVLGTTRARLLATADRYPDEGHIQAFRSAVQRRASAREPVAYITGRRHFRRLELEVNPSVLIPRPETELLVAVALGLPSGARVLDVGTGSGAVALALKDERPDLHIAGSDVSEAALALAEANGRRLGLDVTWRHADLLDGIPGAFDAVVSNPPYVADSERACLAAEIVDHEPPLALYAGPDGLSVIRALLAQLATSTRTRAVLLEVGAGQAERVGELMRAAGFQSVSTERDLASIERVVCGERRS